MLRQLRYTARRVAPFALIATIGAAASPAAHCVPDPSVATRCSCGGVGSIGRAMNDAALVAIAVVDSSAPNMTIGAAVTWRVRIERAWKWPGAGDAPPRNVVVAQRSEANMCAIGILPGERQLVAAWLRPADGMLVLGHKCATPWGAVDTLGPTASDIRRFGGDRAVREFALDKARLLDSLRTYGPGTEPAP